MQVQMQPFCAYRFVVLTGAENNRRKRETSNCVVSSPGFLLFDGYWLAALAINTFPGVCFLAVWCSAIVSNGLFSYFCKNK